MRDQRIPALRALTLALLTAWGPFAHSAGLGGVRIQSSLGQPLRALVSLHGDDTAELNGQCIRTRLESTDGAFFMNPRVNLVRSPQGMEIQLLTSQNINEPALNLQIDVACGMQLRRTYQLLFDPVVILPQTGLAEHSSSASKAGRSSQTALPSVAPSPVQASSAEKREARKKDRKKPVKTDAADNPGNTVKPPRMAIARDLGGKKVVRNVLKLSSDEGTPEGAAFTPGLRLSTELSESRDTGDPKQTAELRAAQQRFAAILRDEDPLQNSEQQLKSVQTKLQELEKENARIRQQDQERLAEMEGMRREMYSGRWIAWLILLLAVAAGAIGWLFWRLREQARTKPAAFWEKTGADDADTEEWDDELLTSVPDSTIVRAARGEVGDDDLDSIDPDWEQGMTVSHVDEHEETDVQARTQKGGAAGLDRKHAQTVQDEAPPVRHGQSAQPKQERKPEAGQPSAAAVAAAVSRTVATARKNSAPQVPQLEEISDLMQEAEFWMLLNDAPRAIEILEPYRDVEQPVSPLPWIYLLDLYHVMREREKYEELKDRIKQVFNTNAPDWSGDAPDVAARSLEDYPHVVDTIRELWEGDQIIPYLEGLLVDERDGARAGFDLAVYREIIHLIGLAREPDIAKRRPLLQIGEPQPRLLSQQVTADPPVANKAGGNDESPDMDVFDRATSGQATTRQAVPRASVLKPPVAAVFKAPAAEAGMPVLPAVEKDQDKDLLPQAETTAAPALAIDDSLQIPDVEQAKPVPVQTPPASVPPQPNVPAFLMAAPDESSAVASTLKLEEIESTVEEHAADVDDELASDMATKLDLAVAYQEIGEHVGARVLLEEVIQGGSPLQAEKAKAMLKKLLKEIDWL